MAETAVAENAPKAELNADGMERARRFLWLAGGHPKGR